MKSGPILLATVLLLSCGGDDGFNPTTDNVAGSYQVTTLRETQNGITLDHLALGVTLGLDLETDGTAAAHIFAPNGAEDGSDLDTDLSGTWTLSGSTVTLGLGQDSFLNEVTFTAAENTLRADQSIGQARLEVVLTRSE